MSGEDTGKCGSNEHKVHFEAAQVQAHDSEITLQYSDSRIDIHLGFLQVNRHYTVTFTMQDDLGEELTFDPLQNLHVKVASYVPTAAGLGHTLVVEFHAHREKLLQERITMKSAKDMTKFRELVFHARVLGKGKGKPATRNGIWCKQVDEDNDSDTTDWPGI